VRGHNGAGRGHNDTVRRHNGTVRGHNGTVRGHNGTGRHVGIDLTARLAINIQDEVDETDLGMR